LDHSPNTLDLSLPNFFPFLQLKCVMEGQWLMSAEEITEKATRRWQRYQMMVSTNTTKSTVNVSKRVSLPTGSTLKEILCK
jgi:hypothetical protein